MIQFRSDCDLIRIHKSPFNETFFIEVNAHNLRFFVAAIYNKTSMPKTELLKVFDKFLESWSGSQKLFISGYFNINIFEQNQFINDYTNLIASNNFVSGIKEAARVAFSIVPVSSKYSQL